ncbi:hypothetical protein TL16_g03674 [Triparma laevis f. inornata]|uniref:Pre-mRNA-splicing factor ISY1 n=1 Tax=Triparma laevis f. inornata TaxID=1714386 RepID=A0A9W7A0E2_9STRA|nr:hypothetical protein TL16_g03674 [Triparma laevis f. inornata]
MARPEEKASAMLNKWTAMKSEHDSTVAGKTDRSGRRPYLSSLCDNPSDAEFWRRQIIAEISRKVSEIQNKGLAEHAIRDLNDGINKLLREKYHWNKRCKDLGGSDYNKLEGKMMAESGEGNDSVLGNKKGYKYFGAARDLPGVKELFMKSAGDIMKRKRGDVYKSIDGSYYGFTDEDDGIMVEVENAKEKELEDDVRSKRIKMVGKDDPAEWENASVVSGVKEDLEDSVFGGVMVNLPQPSEELIAKVMLDKKKREMLAALE